MPRPDPLPARLRANTMVGRLYLRDNASRDNPNHTGCPVFIEQHKSAGRLEFSST